MSRDLYLEGLYAFSEVCETKFKDDVLAVLVMGSVARNEHVQGKSDIDMVGVLKREDSDVQLIAAFLEAFREIMRERKIPKPYLEVLRPSEYERAHLYLDLFSAYDLKANGKIVYGEDIKSRLDFPRGEELEKWAELHIRSIRRNAYKTALGCGRNLDPIPHEIMEALATHVAFAAGIALIGHGVMVSLKREILAKFTKTFPTLRGFDEIMRKVNDNPPKTLEDKRAMIRLCLKFLDELCIDRSQFRLG